MSVSYSVFDIFVLSLLFMIKSVFGNKFDNKWCNLRPFVELFKQSTTSLHDCETFRKIRKQHNRRNLAIWPSGAHASGSQCSI